MKMSAAMESDKFAFRIKIKTKFIIWVTLLTIVVMSLVGYTTYFREERMIMANINESGRILSRALAERCTDPLLKSDFPLVAIYVAQIAESKGKGIAYAMAFDENAMCIAHSALPMEGKTLDDPITLELVSDAVKNTSRVLVDGNRKILDIGQIMKVSTTLKGAVRIGFDLAILNEHLNDTVLQILVVTLLAIGLGSLVSVFLANYILKPINLLTEGARLIGNGTFDQTIPIISYDELGFLAYTFNSMNDNLRHSMSEQRKRLNQLTALHDLSKVISSFRDIDNLLKAIVGNAAHVMNSGKCSITHIEKATGKLSIRVGLGLEETDEKDVLPPAAGILPGSGEEAEKDVGILEHITPSGGGYINDMVIKAGQPILVTDIETDKRFGHLSRKGYRSRSFMVVPIKIKDEVIGTMSLTDKKTGEAYNSDDLKLLSTLAGQAGMAIENAILHLKDIEQQRSARELEMASNIQMNMLPTEFPNFEGIKITGFSTPAKKVGGDYFDILKLSPTRMGVAIGDVSGKGMPAALLMVEIRTIIQARAEDSLSSLEVIRKVNEIIIKDAEPGMYATLFYGIYDLETRILTYTNAGHNYPLLYRAGGEAYETLETTGMFVGMFENAAFKENSVTLGLGDLIIFYTDGITEAMGHSGEMYGLKRLCNTVAENRGKDYLGVRAAIEGSVAEFTTGKEQSDDLTLMVISFA